MKHVLLIHYLQRHHNFHASATPAFISLHQLIILLVSLANFVILSYMDKEVRARAAVHTPVQFICTAAEGHSVRNISNNLFHKGSV